MANVKPGRGETRTMLLPVELTHDEVFARGKQLAAVKDEHTTAMDKLDRAAIAWKATKEGVQNEINETEERMRIIARAVRSGREDRDVEVVDEPNYKTGVMATIRLDTGELVASRGLTEAERQRSLFKAGDDKQAKGASA
jgi:hypothetical protein